MRILTPPRKPSNFNRRIEETRGFDPDQWLPSELIDCAIISLLDAPALRLASVFVERLAPASAE